MKLFKPLFVVLLFFSICFLLNCGGSSDDDDTPTDNPQPRVSWTIMVYGDGDNNLEASLLEDVEEMKSGFVNDQSVYLIVLADREGYYSSSTSGFGEYFSDTRMYRITNGNAERISGGTKFPQITTKSNYEANMGDPDTLNKFIQSCKINYPADDYALILWNHGGGWRKKVQEIINNSATTETSISGLSLNRDNITISESPSRAVCWDETSSDDCLYMDEVQEAIEDQGLTVVGFDACLMGMLEVAYEIKDHASYMIASEELEPGDGWEYDLWLASFFASTNMDAEDLCNSIVDAYETKYSISTEKTTLSAINLSKIDAVYSALNNFSTALYNSITNSTIQDNIFNTITDGTTQSFWDGWGYDFNVDLLHMADNIENDYDYCDSQADALKTAVNNCIIAEWHHTTFSPNANGLAIHFCATEAPNYIVILYAYCNGYPDTYPVDFVQNSDNTYVANYSGGSIVGPGLLYRLLMESM